MADDQKMPPGEQGYSDIPQSSAIVKNSDQARALALKMAGEEPPDECRFHCVTCGWNQTLKFEEEEIAALGGDITRYTGPCPPNQNGCGNMTLVPHARLMGQEFETVYQRAKKDRTEEYKEQAKVLVDTVKEEIVGGSLFDGGPQEPSAGDIHDPRPPSQRDDLPDASEVDDDLTPR